jgi:hypothetical protein
MSSCCCSRTPPGPPWHAPAYKLLFRHSSMNGTATHLGPRRCELCIEPDLVTDQPQQGRNVRATYRSTPDQIHPRTHTLKDNRTGHLNGTSSCSCCPSNQAPEPPRHAPAHRLLLRHSSMVAMHCSWALDALPDTAPRHRLLLRPRTPTPLVPLTCCCALTHSLLCCHGRIECVAMLRATQAARPATLSAMSSPHSLQ